MHESTAEKSLLVVLVLNTLWDLQLLCVAWHVPRPDKVVGYHPRRQKLVFLRIFHTDLPCRRHPSIKTSVTGELAVCMAVVSTHGIIIQEKAYQEIPPQEVDVLYAS